MGDGQVQQQEAGRGVKDESFATSVAKTLAPPETTEQAQAQQQQQQPQRRPPTPTADMFRFSGGCNIFPCNIFNDPFQSFRLVHFPSLKSLLEKWNDRARHNGLYPCP